MWLALLYQENSAFCGDGATIVAQQLIFNMKHHWIRMYGQDRILFYGADSSQFEVRGRELCYQIRIQLAERWCGQKIQGGKIGGSLPVYISAQDYINPDYVDSSKVDNAACFLIDPSDKNPEISFLFFPFDIVTRMMVMPDHIDIHTINDEHAFSIEGLEYITRFITKFHELFFQRILLLKQFSKDEWIDITFKEEHV